MEQKTENVILYAHLRGYGHYAFVPEERAEDESNIWKALFLSRTWGDFWSTLPGAEATRVKGWMATWAEESEPEERAQFEPSDDEPCGVWGLPVVEDGGWPVQLQEKILHWLPPELLKDVGSLSSGPAHGVSLQLEGDGRRLPEVEAVFARHGYRLVWDEERVFKASGRWWDQVAMGRTPEVGGV